MESAASLGASAAVADQQKVAVGLTNTTHFLRSVTAGRVNVDATALSQGRTQQLWRVDFTDESGRLIAHGELRLQNVAGGFYDLPATLAFAVRRSRPSSRHRDWHNSPRTTSPVQPEREAPVVRRSRELPDPGPVRAEMPSAQDRGG